MLIRLAVMPQNVLRPTMKCLTMFRRHGKEVSHSYLIGRCKFIFNQLLQLCTARTVLSILATVRLYTVARTVFSILVTVRLYTVARTVFSILVTVRLYIVMPECVAG